ncbi:unnamed protein product [Linum tenue]|nr:unnamed protein product [Linum tenue]
MLGDTYLTVHRWFKGFNPWKSPIKSTMVWVQLPELPIEFFHPMAVKRIVGFIGKYVRTDRETTEGARKKYARARVEVDLTKTLLSQYTLEEEKYKITYEGLQNVCFDCGCYG